MATPFFKVNNVDMLPYIADGGIDWDEEDIDADGSGRRLNTASMDREIVAAKEYITLNFRPLSVAESQIVLRAASAAKFVTIYTNIHPKYGTIMKSMYNAKRHAVIKYLREDNEMQWSGISLKFTEE